jgi:hypothetical protein
MCHRKGPLLPKTSKRTPCYRKALAESVVHVAVVAQSADAEAGTKPYSLLKMSTSPSLSSASAAVSLQKKRARDRRAQQTFRNKKNGQISQLQSQVAASKNLTAKYEAQIQKLQQLCESLRQANEMLIAKQNCVSSFIHFWESLSTPPDITGSCPTYSSRPLQLCQRQILSPDSRVFPSTSTSISPLNLQVPGTTRDVSTAPDSNPSVIASPSPDPPLWSLTPRLMMAEDMDLNAPWVGNPQLARSCPELPRPLELLYGSKQNPLVNLIHNRARNRSVLDPERLAYGWLTYLYVKWISDPTEARYNRLPDFMKPVPEQLKYPHISTLGGLVWPKMRANLMPRQHLYDMSRLVSLMACCVKVRWPWGQNILCPTTDSAEYTIRQEFYDTFMSLEGWGLTKEFLREYPELLEGQDYESIHYEVV